MEKQLKTPSKPIGEIDRLCRLLQTDCLEVARRFYALSAENRLDVQTPIAVLTEHEQQLAALIGTNSASRLRIKLYYQALLQEGSKLNFDKRDKNT